MFKKLLVTVSAALTFFSLSVTTVMAYGIDYNYAAPNAGLAAGSMALGSMLFICCLIVFGLLINGALAFLVYRDAQKSNVSNELLWAIVVFFFNTLGMIAYFALGKGLFNASEISRKVSGDAKE